MVLKLLNVEENVQWIKEKHKGKLPIQFSCITFLISKLILIAQSRKILPLIIQVKNYSKWYFQF